MSTHSTAASGSRGSRLKRGGIVGSFTGLQSIVRRGVWIVEMKWAQSDQMLRFVQKSLSRVHYCRVIVNMNDPSFTHPVESGSSSDKAFNESVPFCDVDSERRFGSLGRAYGSDVLEVLARSHVVVAGIGGVGSWAVEALARSAVGRLTLVDMDHVAESNINRQVHALDSTLGQSKVLAMAERVAQINPLCEIDSLDDFVTPDNVQMTIAPDADVVLDCTDQLHAKVAMVLCARSRKQPIIVCGAAGGKTDALSLRRGDLRDATHDPLLARLRQTLRKQHGYASAQGRRVAPMGVSVLWLEQPLRRPDTLGGGSALACAGYGSLVTVTASMGLAAAAFALDKIITKADRG